MKNDSVIEISRTELSGILFDLNSTKSNVNFSHVNTVPPEHRPSVLKRKVVKELQESVNYAVGQAIFDPNECRTHLSMPWMKISNYKSEHSIKSSFLN